MIAVPAIDRCTEAVDARVRALAARFEPDGARRPDASAFRTALARAGRGEEATLRSPSAIERAIADAARDERLDPVLLRAVIHVESGGDPHARSAAGAVGLMQLMPGTARDLGVTDPLDPVQNVRGGAAYLRSLLDRFGDPRLAVAAYNAGPGAVERAGGIPAIAETRTYVERVGRAAAALRGAS